MFSVMYTVLYYSVSSLDAPWGPAEVFDGLFWRKRLNKANVLATTSMV